MLTLIPLFAIGVFTGFTLSQTGLVVHWSRARPPRWHYRAAINRLGAAATAVATVVFITTKFTEGAWVVVIAVPAFMYLFTRIHRYYRRAGRALGLGEIPGKPQVKPTVVVVPVAEPIVAFIDRLREHHDKQVVVLIPVALPDRLRYEFLHNHFDLVLTAALRARPDVVSARIPIPLHVTDGDDPVSGR